MSAFKKGVQDRNPIPVHLRGDQLWELVEDIPTVKESKGVHCAGYGVMHNWTKQSIFWSLPYWKSHLLPYNIDVMHTERNVFMNIFNTVMDVKDKTKDNTKARLDIAQLCRRPELELQKVPGSVRYVKPKAKYTLDKSQRLAICEWVKNLKLPDGYASNLSRCVNMKEGNLHGMKSHDCHVFMQRLLPIAFDSLPKQVWKPLVELSIFFRDLTSTQLKMDKLQSLDQNIPIILCKLEQIFPPSFFDSMEHLPIHLPYEAIVGGPVQYRWMYPFERFLRTLKDKVKNKARPEGSICEAYLIEESSTFASYYYPSEVPSRMTRIPHNDPGESSSSLPQISIFNYPGRGAGKCQVVYFDQRDLNVAALYTLNNTPEVEPYLQ